MVMVHGPFGQQDKSGRLTYTWSPLRRVIAGVWALLTRSSVCCPSVDNAMFLTEPATTVLGSPETAAAFVTCETVEAESSTFGPEQMIQRQPRRRDRARRRFLATV